MRGNTKRATLFRRSGFEVTVGVLGKTEAGKEYEADPDEQGSLSANQRTAITIVHASKPSPTL